MPHFDVLCLVVPSCWFFAVEFNLIAFDAPLGDRGQRHNPK